jgi:uncharacterized damage-inducible protein DinB
MPVNTPIMNAYALGHARVLALLNRLSDDQLHWQPNSQSHSIAFEAWHVARWADHLHAHLPVMTPGLAAQFPQQDEIWQQQGLAKTWGFPASGRLGLDETGMHMEDDLAVRLPLPEKAALLDYAARAFAAAEAIVAQLPEDQLLERNVENPQECVLDVLLSHLAHDGRHLGMMECLAGLLTGRGTATV